MPGIRVVNGVGGIFGAHNRFSTLFRFKDGGRSFWGSTDRATAEGVPKFETPAMLWDVAAGRDPAAECHIPCPRADES